MLNITHLLKIASEYGRAFSIEEKTVSHRVFNDGKKLRLIREGADITVGRYNDALVWFSKHWPDGADWPSDVPRPYVDRSAA